MSDDLLLEPKGRVLEATFNRAEGNGVSDGMAREFRAALETAHESYDVVMLKSVGPDFCTGRVRDADAGPPAKEAYARRPEYDSIFYCYRAIRDAQVPVVAAIEGKCMGFGTAVAAVCDVSFASETATFNIPEIEHNVMPTMVMSALYDKMSRNAILWMAYSAEFISAEEAMAYGIVSRVAPAASLVEDTRAFCEMLTKRPRPAVLGLKEYIHNAPTMDEAGAIAYARSIHSMVNTSSDMKK